MSRFCRKIPIITGRNREVGIRKRRRDQLRWFTFDDRKMYRPKEEVAIKGYIRKITAGKFGDVEPIGDVGGAITYSVKDSQNNEIAKGETKLNAFGAFDFKFKLTDNMNLGQRLCPNHRRGTVRRIIIFRFRNFADRNLKFRRKSKPKRRISSAIRRTFRSKRNITRAAVWRTPTRTGR